VRGDLRDFAVERPRRLAVALAALAGRERPCPVAGGTDLYVGLNDGRAPAARYLDLSRLDELRGIASGRDGLRLGALTTYTDLRRSVAVARRAPVLAAMAATVGAAAIQNRGTLGGSLANASPASDPAPVLSVLGAEVELAALDGRRVARRRVPIERFFTAYRETAARPEELVVAVHLPAAALDSGWRVAYRKVGPRLAQAISKVVVASAVRVERRGRRVAEVRLALGSVAPTTVRAFRAEAALAGRRLDAEAIEAAREALAGDIRPIDDLRSTARYRGLVAGNLLAEQLGAV
jgi:CO/xanthine dehydrogenase FAD-binding subunit